MWARTAEVMLGCWLMASPFIFRHPPEATFLWASDLAAGAVMVAVALTACVERFEKLRLLNLLVALYLTLVGFLSEPAPPPPPYQNQVTLAFLLLILAIIPTLAAVPPKGWANYRPEGERPDAGSSLEWRQ